MLMFNRTTTRVALNLTGGSKFQWKKSAVWKNGLYRQPNRNCHYDDYRQREGNRSILRRNSYILRGDGNSEIFRGYRFLSNYTGSRFDNMATYRDYFRVWQRIKSAMDRDVWKQRSQGIVYVSTLFKEPYPRIFDSEFFIFSFILLIEKYAYHIDSEYIKVTLGYKMQPKSAYYEIPFTLGKAIPLFDNNGVKIQKKRVYDAVERLVRIYEERYQEADIKAVFLQIYFEPKKDCKGLDFPTTFDYPRMIRQIREEMESEIQCSTLPETKNLLSLPKRVPYGMTEIKREQRHLKHFMVADIETVMVNMVHMPYAAGFLVVNPGDDLTSIPSSSIQTFFCDNMNTHNFEQTSYQLLFDFLDSLEKTVKSSGLRTVYFHNFARFDGIFLLKYYAERGYKIEPLVRNHAILELKVYIKGKFAFRFRDSMRMLPSSLNSLANTLCPELGKKGDIKHEDLDVSNLVSNRASLIEYLKQDILLLGGVMLKAQEINWKQSNVDIEDVMTVSSLAIRIYRKNFYDQQAFPIPFPTQNQDTFVRRAYYGGHVDVYKPSGENLYYYDVNSLYPFIMKSNPMPGGEPVWKNNLEEVDLDSLFGFIEAYVVCPETISRPFLPYKDKLGTLIFPTGKFTGVYYSEELKFAKKLGYDILPLRGYLYEKKPSPFAGFVSDLYQRRLEAKKRGDEPMSLIIKLVMNSLYGRFGINPDSTVTEICNKERYEVLLKKGDFQHAAPLTDEYFVVQYVSNSFLNEDESWKAPKYSAVHLSAAITAGARIHMYPHIAREDCYYTDTDSIILGSPLSEDLVSSNEMGMFKLENRVKKGIFLSPKSYYLEVENERRIIKHKGAAKDFVTAEWFKNQFEDPSLTEQVHITSNFRIDWKKLNIVKKDMIMRLGLPLSSKRENVYDSNNVWIDTRPKNIIDLGTEDATKIFKYDKLRTKK